MSYIRYLLVFVAAALVCVGQDRLAALQTRPMFRDLEAIEPMPEDPMASVFLDARLFSNWSELAKGRVKCREAWTINYGLSFDASDHVDFLMLTYHRVYRYQDVWLHEAPENMMFKLEFSAGSRVRIEPRLVASIGMFAMYYLRNDPEVWRPFIEAGIGVIYTDFKRRGQGLRWNFNPRVGVGVEIPSASGGRYLLALRAHHISNAELHRENRGINSAFIMLGRYF